ncbi:MAG: hypothetical protein COT43_11335 [Candidatus Marinimicrobia bacterium CG08_land_8_20_14_0_20_45_22]|nr:MAG: hypothetical protein COT43_11335 [Candidatus Marinimicrobia bacterium CG08_land_8_20_14_0_20_45_22]
MPGVISARYSPSYFVGRMTFAWFDAIRIVSDKKHSLSYVPLVGVYATTIESQATEAKSQATKVESQAAEVASQATGAGSQAMEIESKATEAMSQAMEVRLKVTEIES